MALGQNQWYHFGVGAPPILSYFSGDWDVHWGYDLAFDPWPNLVVCSASIKPVAWSLRSHGRPTSSAAASLPGPATSREDGLAVLHAVGGFYPV